MKILRDKDIKRFIFGFTLIELLVVISIIGVLISVVASRYVVAEKQARDTKRKSDLNQYRLALENYAVVNNSLYPTPAGSVCVEASSLCDDNSFKTNYMPSCPLDPRELAGSSFYQYCSGAGVYLLNSKLETGGKMWQICSNGLSCNAPTNYPSDSSACRTCQ